MFSDARIAAGGVRRKIGVARVAVNIEIRGRGAPLRRGKNLRSISGRDVQDFRDPIELRRRAPERPPPLGSALPSAAHLAHARRRQARDAFRLARSRARRPEKPNKKTTHMNGETYHRLVTSKFSWWRRACFGDDEPCRLVQDHEKCLWQEHNLQALRQAGCAAIDDYPKSSPDLNAIEEVWNLIRQRLESTEPEDFEDRLAFVARLRRCVNWLNERHRDALLTMCTNQKLRGKDVIKLTGAKTKW